MASMPTVESLLDRVPDPSAPLLTYYDVATGERTELSVTTTRNWVAKTANLLVDELDSVPGTRVRLRLPSHWLRFVWLLAVWGVRGVVVDEAAEIGVCGPALDADEPRRLASSLEIFVPPFATPPEGFIDLGTAVPEQPDVFTALDPSSGDDPAVELAGRVRTQDELVADAVPDDRRLAVMPESLASEADRLVAALAGGGSLVLVRGAAPADLARIAEQENAETVPSR